MKKHAEACPELKAKKFFQEDVDVRIQLAEVKCPGVDRTIANLFFECNIPFKVVKSSPFKSFMRVVLPSMLSSLL